MEQLPRRSSRIAALYMAVLAVIIVAFYAFEQRLIDVAANAQGGACISRAEFIRSLPYPFVWVPCSDRRTYLLLVAIGLAQAVALFMLYRIGRSYRFALRDWAVFGVCGIAMLLISLDAR